MKLTTTIPVRPWLWLACSTLVFVALGFVDFIPAFNKGDGLRYWHGWALFWTLGRQYLADAVCFLSAFTFALLVAAAALGLVLQSAAALIAQMLSSPEH